MNIDYESSAPIRWQEAPWIRRALKARADAGHPLSAEMLQQMHMRRMTPARNRLCRQLAAEHLAKTYIGRKA